MVKTHLTGILAYYKHRITNALAEGTNSKIEWIKNTGRGSAGSSGKAKSRASWCGGGAAGLGLTRSRRRWSLASTPS